jgi:hypothetical protein
MQKLLAQSTRRALPARASAVHALSPPGMAQLLHCKVSSDTPMRLLCVLARRPAASSREGLSLGTRCRETALLSLRMGGCPHHEQRSADAGGAERQTVASNL